MKACRRQPLLCSGQSFWLQIQRSWDRFPALPGFRSSTSKRGTLSLVSTTEELLGRNSSGSGLENWEYGSNDPPRWTRAISHPQKLALISPTRGVRSIGIVRSQTKATMFVVCCCRFITVFTEPENNLYTKLEKFSPYYFILFLQEKDRNNEFAITLTKWTKTESKIWYVGWSI
jgi:hypothetical protein